MTIDLNCDMGEGMGNDAAIMPFISSANIACGFHAGDDQSIEATIRLAKQHGVAVGAHPSYPDRENFGRKTMVLSAWEIYHITFIQVKLLKSYALACETTLQHVKPHGALYNAAAVNTEIADPIAKAVKDVDATLTLFGLANSELIKSAQRFGLTYKHEVFADRTYQPDGTLTPRTQPNALIESESESIRQVLGMVNKKHVTTVNGNTIPIQADTICIHGDGAHAVEFTKAVRTKLMEEGIQISAA